MNPATTTVKTLISFVGVLLLVAIFTVTFTSVFNNVNEQSTKKWVNDNLKRYVEKQCRPYPFPGTEPSYPKNGRVSNYFDSDNIKIEWKGRDGHQLHLVAEEDGDTKFTVRIGTNKDATLPGAGFFRGCDPDNTSIRGDLSGSGTKSFKIISNGRGAIIDVQE